MLKRMGYLLWCLVAICMGSVAYGQDHADDAGGLAVGAYGSGGKTAGAGGVYLAGYQTGGIGGIIHSGGMLDLGLTAPVSKSKVDTIFSINYLTTYNTRLGPYQSNHRQVFPFATFGYSRFITSGNALNYGAGILWRYRRHAKPYDVPGIRFEYRDYFLPGTGHMPGFRISFESADTEPLT